MSDLDRFTQPLWGEQQRRKPDEDDLYAYKQERDSGLVDRLEGGEESDGD